MSRSRSVAMRQSLFAVLAWVLGAYSQAFAQVAPTPDLAWIESEVKASAAALVEPADPTIEQRVEIQLPPDWGSRVQGAPCTPQAQTVSRRVVQGMVQVELQCPQTSWRTRLPVRIQVWREVAVAQRTLQANRPLSSGDWRLETVDVADLSQAAASSAESLRGAELVRSIRAGTPIPLNALRQPPALRSGDSVSVVLSGQGFQIRTRGRSAQTAAIGDTVRVQIDGGQLVSGQVQADHSVRVEL